MQQPKTWILEITVQDQHLNMSLNQKEQVSPLKTVSSVPIDFSRIEYLVNEVVIIINKANQKKLIDKYSVDELTKNTRLLYDLLFSRQIKARLSSVVSANLVFSLDERLIDIPWEILFDGTDFLCLKFNLGRSIHTKTSEIQPTYRSIPLRPKMLILANPTGDLKSAYQEGLRIKNFLIKNGRINVDFKAQNIDSNYVRKNLRDYDIIHFAGHCEYDLKNPEESGWVLSDGWISAREFFALSAGSAFPSVIFVNACQSARTSNNILDPESQGNVYTLAQAFLFAGVRHYLGSFWRIEDNSSWEFAEEFYSQIVNSKPIGEAVRLARLRLFRKYGISAINWSAYVLYGDPSFVLFKDMTAGAGRVSTKLNFIGSFLCRIFKLVQIRKIKIAALSLIMLVVMALGFIKAFSVFNPGAKRLFLKAEQLYAQGNNYQIISLLDQAIGKDSLYLPAWRLRGDVYFRLGKFSDALSNYSDYARFSERKKDYKHLAAAYIKIAWIYHMWGDYQKSEGFYQKALNLSRKHKDKLNEADAMARLAVWYVDKGDNESAFSLLMKSSEINRQRDDDPEHRFNLACDYFNIAFLYVEKGDYPIAKEFLNKSEEIFEGLGAIPELGDYYFNMGEVSLFEKNYDLALEYYQKGLDLDRKLDHRFNLSSDYWMLGEFYWETGKFDQAESNFREAIFICQEIDNRPVLAGVYYDLGLMYKEMNELEKAKEYLSQALVLYKDIDIPDYQEVLQEYLALE
ncbi:MAG: tetratricopeptide repeat protein [Candidatus Omnitrophota bacterium]